ncbi:helix-turn-helix domain-containing protein [Rickettsia endosymbiont of Halotydeus destructor]|uniref:helix-turn-helix domain-containing protein n=1 Tax=Rickettsia endosymbiont of Halotydeus destructor TaxID=2996754 RepID=UPI003BB1FA80
MVRKNDDIQKMDTYIGKKIYSLRIAKGLSRQQLAEQIDVTHQQLQKYEKAINRISIGRLVFIAKALDKNIDYFFEDLEEAGNLQPIDTKHQRMRMEVSRNFEKIDSTDQQAINNLIKCLANNKKK